jgi:polar amino acid transport system substrate-binding protein
MDAYDVTINMVPWKRGLLYVERGKVAALFPPYFAEDRVPWMVFSEPILEEQIVIFGNSTNLKGKTKWPEDFYGFRFGMNTGFNPTALGGIGFADACKTGEIELQEANSTVLNLKKLQADRIEFYLNDRFTDISSYPSQIQLRSAIK